MSIKFTMYALVVAAFAILASTANHFHNKWIAVKTELAIKEAELAGALQSAKDCSENTKKLFDQTQVKIEEVAKAQAAAAVAAKGNYNAANRILEAVASNPNKCVATIQLIEDYKRGLFEDKK
jgi:hypothetical protein